MDVGQKFVSLNGATAAGAGAEFSFGDLPVRPTFVAFQISYTGGPSVAKVGLELTLDGINWHSFVENPDLPANGYVNYSFTVPPCAAIRAKLITLTGGSSPTVSCTVGFS